MTDLKRTTLYDLHIANGAKMVPFAGYEMPVQYPLGVLKEHQHTRDKAGLFDVSHMGQLRLTGPDYATIAAAVEALVPVDAQGLAEGRQRYGFLTNSDGGILDDLMFANRGDHIFMVVNAGCKDADIAHLRAHLPQDVMLEEITNRALIALQGPAAEAVLSQLDPRAADMRFMDVFDLMLGGVTCWVSRSGYTGEDGYEISVPSENAAPLAEKLLAHPDVEPIGLGARDSLRLEAGLCLYGHDITEKTTPVEAGLTWAMQKARRAGGAREGGFPGAAAILTQMAKGPARKRVGLAPEGRAPMREGVKLFASETGDDLIGEITSGGFGPTVQGPVAMGYVTAHYSPDGTVIYGDLRGRRQPVRVVPLPFTPARFKR
ncbi:aminomethyltransferase [Poseidonocella pacifica]|uniref:aminomethyltransferase n=1 Tax=Poseidonocella pacifica TaxID=871651 RepID=A0A1I0XTN7_9RHOB|nr:glycine cleavage system aminomethyltransferase GcvT [Poseidonocella pacifica]SFB04361.1 aminomethyltransferase [Poseidonocella pacifica]